MRSGARAAALLAAAALAAFPMAGCSQEGSVGSGEEREDVSDEFGYVPEWFEEDARVEPFSKRALTEKLFVRMDWLEMLIGAECDRALEEGRADSPKLLALQEDFGQMAKVLARVVSADEGDMEALEAAYRDMRAVMGLDQGQGTAATS